MVYIVGPFRKEPKKNKLKFEAMAFRLWKEGFFAFNPIANCYYMAGRIDEDEFVRRDVEALKKLKFDAVILLDGWEDSSGANREIEAAKSVHIPVFTSFNELCVWRDACQRVEGWCKK